MFENEKQKSVQQVNAMPFRSGFAPETSKLIDLLKHGKEGETKTDSELYQAIGKDTAPGGKGYSYLASAIRFVEREHGIRWERIPKTGLIKCLDSGEKVEVIRRGRDHIRKTAKKNIVTSKSVKLMDLPNEDRAEYLALQSQAAAVAVMMQPSTTKRLETRGTAPEIDRDRLFAAMEK